MVTRNRLILESSYSSFNGLLMYRITQRRSAFLGMALDTDFGIFGNPVATIAHEGIQPFEIAVR